MPELNLKQITDKLNAEFAGEGRKLVFWYDDQAEFAEDIESLELVNAKLLRLAPDKQFYAKHFLERLDREGNYLVYAPFPKPPVRDNHLEDTLLYSNYRTGEALSATSIRYIHTNLRNALAFAVQKHFTKYNPAVGAT